MKNLNGKREWGKRSVAFFALLFSVLFSVSCGKETEPVSTEQHQEEASEEEFVEKWQEGTVFHNGKSYRYDSGIKTYLFLGIDKDGKVEPVPDGIDGGQSDALFLLVVDEKEGKQSLIKIHRNTMTEVEVYDEDGTDLGPQRRQICLQHGYGDGARLSCIRTRDAVEHLFYGIPIKGYLAMNMGGIRILNDAVGGVTLTVLEDVSAPDLGVELKAGDTVTLNGDEAYAYLRRRDTSEFDSATGRMERQGDYLKELIPMLQGMGKSKANEVLEELDDYVISDIVYLDLLEETEGMEFDGDQIYEVPGETILNGDFEEYHVDEDALYELILDVFYDEMT